MPFQTSVLPTISFILTENLLEQFQPTASPTSMPTPHVHLFTAVTGTINQNTTVSAFTEATFPGYAPVAFTTLLGPILLPDSGGVGLHAEADFLAGAVTTPGQNILGYWVDNGSTVLYLAEQFATAIPITVPGDFISLDVIFPVQFEVQTN